MKNLPQPWRCEKCNGQGTVLYGAGSDVYEVRNAIEADHNRVSPDCEFGLAFVTVTNTAIHYKEAPGGPVLEVMLTPEAAKTLTEALRPAHPTNATATRIRMAVIPSNGDNEWEIELGPFEQVINVDVRGTSMCVFIEVGDEQR